MHNLYVIGVKPDGPIKVGVSGNVKKRLKTLQDGFHLPLEAIKVWKIKIDYVHQVETISHYILSEHRLRGEWFECHPDKAIKEINKIIETTKNGKDCSFYKKDDVDYVKSERHQIAGQNSAKIAKLNSRRAAAKIADRWPLSSEEWPTRTLLKEADISLNTAKAHLGKRPIAQYNYQAKMKRKANAKR